MTNTQHNWTNEGTAGQLARGRVRAAGSRRRGRPRGTALILVIALLGILFVVGVAFLKTMDFDAQVISHERKQDQVQGVMDAIHNAVGRVLRESFVDKEGVPYRANQSSTLVANSGPPFKITFPSYGLSTGVHGIVGDSEPDYYCGNVDPNDPANCLDIEAYGYSLPPFWGALFKRDGNDGQPYSFDSRYDRQNQYGIRNWPIDQSPYTFGRQVPNDDRTVPIDNPPRSVPAFMADPLAKRVSPGMPVDANGDGIFDARQFDLSWLGLAEGMLGPVRAAVNDPLHSLGGAYLSLQVVDHGAMVNLNYGHDTLVKTVLADTFNDDGTPKDKRDYKWQPRYDKYPAGLYVPALEEPILRHRGWIVPREIPPSLLHGNPENFSGNDDNPSGGDLGPYLLPEVVDGQHDSIPWWRWWPLEHDEYVNDDNPMWRVKMTRRNPVDEREYDRRHLLTTVGHDDLLMRGGFIDADGNGEFNPPADREWIARMREIYGNPPSNPPKITSPTAFDYHWYPYPESDYDKPIVNNDPLAGRRLLSLPWIDDVLLDELKQGGVRGIDRLGSEYWPSPEPLTGRDYRAIGLIQSAFTMLLLNARGDDWGLDGNSLDFHRISLTAASLTANLIDFADSNDTPMQVLLRDSDPASASFGQVIPDEMVYGLEHQPFITEVVATTEDNPDRNRSAWAVELFNPFACDPNVKDGNGNSICTSQIRSWYSINMRDFGLYVTRGSDFPDDVESQPGWYPFDQQQGIGFLQPRGFLVVGHNATTFYSQAEGNLRDDDPTDFNFKNDGTIFLARKDHTGKYYAVDRFDLGPRIGEPRTPAEPYGMERTLRRPDPGTWPLEWTFTVPMALEYAMNGPGDHSLGDYNEVYDEPEIRPVEIVLDEIDFQGDVGDLKRAFPTTGSLLLLMRHANYRQVNNESVPFNIHLAKDLDDPFDTFRTIDNGRMPVFDDFPTGVQNGVKTYRHHIDPVADPLPANDAGLEFLPGGTKFLPWGQLVFDYFTALPLSSPADWTPKFDATKPYDNLDVQPFVDMNGVRVHGRVNLETAPWSVIEGLPLMPAEKFTSAVRGKFNAVLDYLAPGPSSPRPKFRIGEELAQAIVAYRDGRQVGRFEADPKTGRYDVFERELAIPGHEGAMRRSRPGTGFLTVGELLNVRRLDAASYGDNGSPPWVSNYRMDAGVVHRLIDNTGNNNVPGYERDVDNKCWARTNPQEDYIQAIALMVALGDWATTRSHVFTVYGTLRGDVLEVDDPNDPLFSPEEIDRVNERAIRFQETLDRLPVLEGPPDPGLNHEKPVRIGRRTVGQYEDAFNK